MASPIYTTGDPVWNSLEDATRVPLTSELESGWPCGEVDPELLNFVSGHGWNLIHNMLTLSGLTPSIPNLHQLAQAIQSGKINYAVATGTANAWTVAPTLAVPAYAAGRVLWIAAPDTNTSTTVNANVSGLGNRRIKKANGADPQPDDLVSGVFYPTIDDGTNIRVVSPLASDIRAASLIITRQKFTSSGTFTALVAGPHRFLVWGAGGGGGGSGSGLAGSGGSGGAYGEVTKTLALGETVAVVVGAGGVGGLNAGTNGGAGGSSSVTIAGVTYTAGGGPGGITNTSGGSTNSPALATTSGAFDRVLIGQQGGPGYLMTSPSAAGGYGGGAPLGGQGGTGGGGTPSAGTVPGGGGGGNANSSSTAGGARGEVWVEY